MRVLLTGADGYIGVRMGRMLLERDHDVTGLDTGFHRVGWLYNSDELSPPTFTRHTRHGTIHEELPGFACSWDVERGAKDLIEQFRRVGFDHDLYGFRGHTRIKQIRHLLGTGQVDHDLYWR